MSKDRLLSVIAGEDFNDDTLLELLFNQYRIARDKKIIYNEEDYIPQNLIKMYFKSSNHSDFKEIYELFKKRYSNQESKLEEVHSKNEIEGLGIVYDYIRSDEWIEDGWDDIFIILKINELLFSKTPFPEAGGQFRTMARYWPGTGMSTSDPDMIWGDVLANDQFYVDLLRDGRELAKGGKTGNDDQLIEYINRCIELMCRLIRIHPFSDGNGRTMRALVNLLFKEAGLPPVYAKYSEKEPYDVAIIKAVCNNDYKLIQKFYYYKICDSILELDIANRLKNENIANASEITSQSKTKVKKPNNLPNN